MSDLTGPGGLFEIVEEAVLGVPTRVWKNAPSSLRDMWDQSAGHADRTYLVYEDTRYTYAQAHRAVAALARQLTERWGVGQGDRVAIAMRNYPEWALAFWATVAIGAVAVPLNAWWTGAELAYGLADSGAVVLFADRERRERLIGHLDPLRLRAVVAVREPEASAGVEPFDDMIQSLDERLPDVDISPDDDATILYTSGTTGKPKGAVGTHRNIGNFVMNGLYAAATGARVAPPPAEPGAPPPAPPVTLLTFPLFHVGGLQSHLVPYTMYGGTLVLMYRWDAEKAVGLIESEKVTAFSGVPTTVFQLLDAAQRRGVDLTSVTGMSSGATLVPPELVRRIDTQFASRVSPANGYGLTETSGAMVFNAGTRYIEQADSVGVPISPVNEVAVVDDEGRPAPNGIVGEVWLKGPTVVRGYFNNPEATAESFSDGWFHTGDLGRLDEGGRLYVVDRIKDVVIRGGENIYAAEVEGALFEHPDVRDVAVIGLPHPQLGEEVCAVVRLRDGAPVDEDALRRHVAERLAAFKVPARIFFRDEELPRNAAGKVLKRQLREELSAAR